MPAIFLEECAVVRINFALEVQRELQLARGARWKLGELQERIALVVLEDHALPLGDVLASEPGRYRREASAVTVVGVRPEIQADDRSRVKPTNTAVGDGSVRPHVLPGRHISVVRENHDLPAADPVLQQAGIDVDERAAPEAA